MGYYANGVRQCDFCHMTSDGLLIRSVGAPDGGSVLYACHGFEGNPTWFRESHGGGCYEKYRCHLCLDAGCHRCSKPGAPEMMEATGWVPMDQRLGLD